VHGSGQEPLLFPSHLPPALQLLVVPSGEWLAVPLAHTSFVHSLLSLGRSLASAIVMGLPIPLQTVFWQSPAVLARLPWPFGTKVVLHKPAVQA